MRSDNGGGRVSSPSASQRANETPRSRQQTSIILFPLTMISKRIEAGKKPILSALFDGLEKDVQRLRKEGAHDSK